MRDWTRFLVWVPRRPNLDCVCDHSPLVAVQIPFMSLLFEYRSTFHSIAADALSPGTTASTIVCWVDAILATLNEAVVELAYGRSIHSNDPGDLSPDVVRKHCEDNNLRAASQLPCMLDTSTRSF
jgi:hypothetical protein